MSEGNKSNPFGFDPEEIRRMLEQMLGGQGAGVNAEGAQFFGQIFSAFQGGSHSDDGIDWSVARKSALETLSQATKPSAASSEEYRAALLQAITPAMLWLDEATAIGSTPHAPRVIDRVEWVTASVDTWVQFAAPVADSVALAMRASLAEQIPEEMREMVGGATKILERIAGTIFASQLGSVIGRLAQEVLAGGDIAVPVVSGEAHAGGTFVLENITFFGADLDISTTDIALYLAVRELAFARLFRHAKWLRPHVLSAITEYAQGITLDTSQLQDLAHDFDPAHPEGVNELLSSGALIPPRTEQQEQALARLGHMLALIGGWVDAVTDAATKNLPAAPAIAEMIRRKSAVGGPAEQVFGTLVGLELRPRKLREACELWALIADRGDIQLRDSLWDHPDLLPTIAEVENHGALLERLGLGGGAGAATAENDLDDDLRKLLRGDFDR
ncbi:zinc-dependent metalloprotease [Canibacter zhoujuaniae]|uniref:zinc-dependent metalloprotease n=1 Tax=Canibacter zhoujuaniae TaxID=2708343 RepID=UPI001FBAD1AF|nr:zinc-dependent metalloprotease [Canibacter zhoujuaniae]